MWAIMSRAVQPLQGSFSAPNGKRQFEPSCNFRTLVALRACQRTGPRGMVFLRGPFVFYGIACNVNAPREALMLWKLKAWWVRMTWNPKRDNPPEYWLLIAEAVERGRRGSGVLARPVARTRPSR